MPAIRPGTAAKLGAKPLHTGQTRSELDRPREERWCDCLLGRCLDEDEVGDGQEADASRSSIVHYACLRALPDRTAPCRKIVWQRATLVILLTKGLPRQLRTSRS